MTKLKYPMGIKIDIDKEIHEYRKKKDKGNSDKIDEYFEKV